MQLTPRRARVLKHVVEEYVVTAVPVASEMVVRKYQLNVSSATIRNDFAALEEDGLISHPHTSAGRIPTDVGYRYYLEHLMGQGELAPDEVRTIAHQFHQVESDVDEWVRLASSVLSNVLHNTAVVTMPGSASAKMRRIELVPLGDRTVLIAVLLDSGALRKQLIETDQPVARDELVRLSNRLTALLTNKTATWIATEAGRAIGIEQLAMQAAERILRQAEDHAFQQVYYEGLSHMLTQP